MTTTEEKPKKTATKPRKAAAKKAPQQEVAPLLEAPREDLEAALRKLAPVCKGNSTLPVLQTVYLKSAQAGVRLAATDLDHYVEAMVHLPKVGSPALPTDGLCLSAKDFLAAVQRAPTSEIRLEPGRKDRVVLVAGSFRVELPFLPGEDFPKLPENPFSLLLEMEAAELAKALAATVPFMSTDASRAAIQTVMFAPNSGGVVLVSSDGRRLQLEPLGAGKGAFECQPLKETLLLPDVGATLWARLLTGVDGTAEVTANENFFCLKLEEVGVTVWSKQMQVAAINFWQVIPKPVPGHQVNRKALLEAVQRVNAFKQSGDRSANLLIERKAGALHLSREIPGGVAATDTVQLPADDPARPGLEKTAFDASYLQQALEHLPGEVVWLDQADDLSPLALSPVKRLVGDERRQRVHVLMPRRTA